MSERFLRSEMLLGRTAMEKLAASHVCVVGLGGVGSWAAEILARSGVGELTLIDQDVCGESNINAYLHIFSRQDFCICQLLYTNARQRTSISIAPIRES